MLIILDIYIHYYRENVGALINKIYTHSIKFVISMSQNREKYQKRREIIEKSNMKNMGNTAILLTIL